MKCKFIGLVCALALTAAALTGCSNNSNNDSPGLTPTPEVSPTVTVTPADTPAPTATVSPLPTATADMDASAAPESK